MIKGAGYMTLEVSGKREGGREGGGREEEEAISLKVMIFTGISCQHRQHVQNH